MTQKQPQTKESSLPDLRRQIDMLDAQLISLLSMRQRCVERVIEIKRVQKLPARIPDRIDEVLERVRKLAEAEKLEPDSDIHASAEYRKEVGAVMVRRALMAACGITPTPIPVPGYGPATSGSA